MIWWLILKPKREFFTVTLNYPNGDEFSYLRVDGAPIFLLSGITRFLSQPRFSKITASTISPQKIHLQPQKRSWSPKNCSWAMAFPQRSHFIIIGTLPRNYRGVYQDGFMRSRRSGSEDLKSTEESDLKIQEGGEHPFPLNIPDSVWIAYCEICQNRN